MKAYFIVFEEEIENKILKFNIITKEKPIEWLINYRKRSKYIVNIVWYKKIELVNENYFLIIQSALEKGK